jgi:membrane peptidoglycan carboxypeptidase
MGWSLQDLNPSSVLKPSLEPVILLEAADGQKLSRRGPLRGVPVARRDIPRHLADAVVAIEDRRFYDHQGIDPQGILRAFARNMRAGAIRQGGSTITQQLARTLIREDERTFRRKIREAVLAVFMERKLSKDDILTRYLNNIYFGAGLTGVSAAARVYFDKAVRDLSLQEAALLAGLIQAPSHLNPLRNLDEARSRAALVFDAMVASGKLDPSEAEAAKRKPAELNPGKLPSSSGSWFADWSYEEAAKIAGSFEGATTGTVRVRTTLSPELQAWAERTVSAAMAGRAGVNDATQVALVAMRLRPEPVQSCGQGHAAAGIDLQAVRLLRSAAQRPSTL